MTPNCKPPAVWKRKRLSDIFEIKASGDIDWARWCRFQNSAHPHPVYANGRADSGLHGYASYAVEQGDAITVTARGTLGELGFAFFREAAFTPIGRLLVLRSKGEADACFFASYINCIIRFAQENTGVAQLTAPQVIDYEVDVPPIEEQRAIATTLSDVDALLAKIDQLIAKKRDLKQATMQQLLTGQTRLPGFSGEWEVKPMKSLGQTYGGLAGKTKEDFGHGASKYIPFMNVMTDTVIDPNWFETVYIAQNEAQNLAKKGDLFFNGSSETPEEVGFCSVLMEDIPNLYLNSFCFGFRFNTDAKVCGLFFAYWFRCADGRAAMSVLAQGATRYNIAKSAFMRLSIPQPSQEEQTAIATVLSDMDAELATMEDRRDKTRALKQGMMQALLTGRIRLVEGN